MPPRTRSLAAAAVAVTMLAALSPATAHAATSHHPRPGAPGVGDSYFPKEGNGGYDARHYDIRLAYDPKSNHVDATSTLHARATQSLSRFDLDLKQLTVTGVKVNGKKAKYTRSGQELKVTPKHALRRGANFTVAVAYNGDPKPVERPDIGTFGWIKTPDGAYVVCEPDGASTWFPGNDHPSDKATYAIDVTVPKGTTVLSNGELAGQRSKGGKTSFAWRETKPMASYLAMLAIGQYNLKKGHTASGVPVLTAVSPNHAADAQALYDDTVKAIDWEEKVFGKYPFTSTGGIRVGVDVAFSLENQTRPVYGFAPDQATITHELAHQWFGDSVSVKKWRDVWLNEGFATYAEWLYDEQHGGDSAQKTFDTYYNEPSTWKYYDALWNTNTVHDPGAQTLFDIPVYYRGGMTLQALRGKVGDKAFFKILKNWAPDHKYGNASTEQFVRYAERVSHKNLDDFFHVWLDKLGRPTKW